MITVFGGSGSIGRPLSRYLAENGYRIRIADVREPTDMPPGAEFFKCDIRDPGAVRKALDGVDFALSLAIIQIPVINERRRLAYEVNIQGTVNVCEAVDELPDVKGMLLAGTWHVFGEMGLQGPIDEGFGFRPDKVEPRARLYALHKVCQEVIVRIYDEMSDKVFGVIRQGTVLGEVMPEKTAANIFINKALRGETITPYRHSAHRPMLFIYIGDLCRAYKAYIDGVLQGSIRGTDGSIDHVVNVCYPEPVTVLELAHLVKEVVEELTGGRIKPEVEVVDKGLPELFSPEDKYRMKVDVGRARELLGLEELVSPREAIRRIVEARLRELGLK